MAAKYGFPPLYIKAGFDKFIENLDSEIGKRTPENLKGFMVSLEMKTYKGKWWVLGAELWGQPFETKDGPDATRVNLYETGTVEGHYLEVGADKQNDPMYKQ